MRNQDAGATRLPTCPSDLSLAAIRSADSRSDKGPTRTRYRIELPDPPGKTNTENPCPFTWRVKLSAFARLAKLPSCTDQDLSPVDVGEAAEDSTATRRAAAWVWGFAGALLGVGVDATLPRGAGMSVGLGAGMGAALEAETCGAGELATDAVDADA